MVNKMTEEIRHRTRFYLAMIREYMSSDYDQDFLDSEGSTGRSRKAWAKDKAFDDEISGVEIVRAHIRELGNGKKVQVKRYMRVK